MRCHSFRPQSARTRHTHGKRRKQEPSIRHTAARPNQVRPQESAFKAKPARGHSNNFPLPPLSLSPYLLEEPARLHQRADLTSLTHHPWGPLQAYKGPLHTWALRARPSLTLNSPAWWGMTGRVSERNRASKTAGGRRRADRQAEKPTCKMGKGLLGGHLSSPWIARQKLSFAKTNF